MLGSALPKYKCTSNNANVAIQIFLPVISVFNHDCTIMVIHIACVLKSFTSDGSILCVFFYDTYVFKCNCDINYNY